MPHLIAKYTQPPISLRYLQALLAAVEKGNPEWGSYVFAVPVLQRLIQKTKEKDYWTLPSKDRLFEYLEERNVPSWELDVMRRVKVPAVRKFLPNFDESAIDRIEKATGILVLTQGLDSNPDFNHNLRGIAKAFEVLPSRYPFAFKLLKGSVRKILLFKQGRGSEDGYWADYQGHTLGLRVREGYWQNPMVTILHELGHVFEGKSDVLELMDVYGIGHGPFVSDYAGKNASEDFAETFMYFWRNSAYLRRKTPDKFADMQARIQQGTVPTHIVGSVPSRVAARWFARVRSFVS